MRLTHRQTFIPALALALAAMACGGRDTAADQAARDIELTPTTGNTPVNDSPAGGSSKAPAAPTKSTPTKATPRPALTGVIAAGSLLAVRNGARICTNTHKTGDRFVTTLGGDVTGTNGARIPAGALVTLVVTESAISKNSKDQWKLAFDVVNVTVADQTIDVVGDVTNVAKIEAVRSQSTGQQVGKVATGAAIGAVAGQVLGKNTKSTVIGAAVGAAAGGAVAAGTADYEGCLPINNTITIALTAPLTVKVSN